MGKFEIIFKGKCHFFYFNNCKNKIWETWIFLEKNYITLLYYLKPFCKILYLS